MDGIRSPVTAFKKETSKVAKNFQLEYSIFTNQHRYYALEKEALDARTSLVQNSFKESVCQI